MQHNADKRQNVALYWNGEREEKHFQSHMLLFVFYGDIQGNTDNKHNVALYIQIEKKKFLCEAANQRAESRVEGSKCPCYEIISAQFKQTQTRMIVIVRWKKFNMIHQVSYSLTAKSKFDVALRLFSL